MTRTPIDVVVNGTRRGGVVEPRRLLVHYLRDDLGLTGTHIGCETSQCGACVVLVDGMAAKSCTLFAVQVDGSQVITVEGLARDDGLHPIQEGFWDRHGLQCGFCTAGMMMTALDLIQHNPDPSEEEIRHALHGNLCRCTGYQHIVEAVHEAAERLAAEKSTS